MRYTVVFAPEAEEQLIELYRYIAQVASPEIAERYTDAIVTYCEGLQTFPHRSNRRVLAAVQMRTNLAVRERF